jgi:MFS family permease
MSRDRLAAPDTGRLPESDPRHFGWRVVALCFVVAMFAWAFGFYGHGVFLAELQRTRGLDPAVLALSSTGYYLVSAVLVAFVPDALARFGPRVCVLAGVASLCAAAWGLAYATAPGHVIAAYGVMSIAWTTMSVGAIVAMVGPWFDVKRGLATSLALTGASLAGVLLIPALLWAIGRFGFATAVLGLAGAAVVCVGPLAIAYGRRPPPRAPSPASTASAAVRGPTRAQRLRDPHFWSFTGPFAIAQMAQVGFLVHEIAALRPLIGTALAGLAVSLTTGSAIVGRLTLATCVDRLDARRTSAWSMATQAGALAVVAWAPASTPVLLGACMLFGASIGNLVTLPAAIAQRELAAEAYGPVVALSAAVCQFVFALGPGLLGLLAGVAGYGIAIGAFAALYAGAAIAVALLRPRAPSGAAAPSVTR